MLSFVFGLSVSVATQIFLSASVIILGLLLPVSTLQLFEQFRYSVGAIGYDHGAESNFPPVQRLRLFRFIFLPTPSFWRWSSRHASSGST